MKNNTDVDGWADARGLRINGKRGSKSWRCVKVPIRLAGSRQHYCGGHDLRLPLMIKPWRCPNLSRPLHRIAPESPMIARMAIPPTILQAYESPRFVIECPAPSTTIFFAMKNSIIFISALSLAGMMLASCNSLFAPDETATTRVAGILTRRLLSKALKVMAIQSVVDITNRILWLNVA